MEFILLDEKLETLENYTFYPPRDTQNEINAMSFNKNYNIINLNNNKLSIFVKLIDPKLKTVIFSYGNGQDLSMVEEFLLKVSDQNNVNVISYDYTGYGRSIDEPSVNKCFDNLKQVIEYTQSLEIEKKNIILVGYSFGAAVTLENAYNN